MTNAPENPAATPRRLPLEGVRVVEFTHMIMGPSCGMVLADLGADVVKVEPAAGDNTRRLLGAGAGFFAAFNRNKKSLALDINSAKGREIALKLASTADVFIENFKPGAMDKLGLGYTQLSKLSPRLVYVSHKGFLAGPYEHRTALDEVVQMMGGLAYMTGPQGRPLRAGSSVNDIMGGMFGAIGVLAALNERDHPVHGTGRGRLIESALFENKILLVAQHMLQFAVTGKAANPMPNRISPWAIYEVFSVKNDEQIFIAVVSDTQWEIFCKAFCFDDFATDERLAVNNKRVAAREWLMPELKRRLKAYTAAEIAERFEAHGLPYAPITKPHELFDDPHLVATGGLAPITIPADANQLGRRIETSAPLLPLAIDGERLPIRSNPPSIGEHASEVLASLGYTANDIAQLREDGTIAGQS
jgi:crotonobetainyl-CoA:carnitine CoA-transferase CaiB-like acyl-CoA transferase